MASPHIGISGILGAGKTTLVRGLSKQLGCLPLEERFLQNPFLEAFYREPARWAFRSCRAFLQLSLDDCRRACESTQGGIQERIPDEHVWVFGLEYRVRGYLSMREFDLLQELIFATRVTVQPPDLLIHIDIEPAEALTRVRGRARAIEREVDLSYLTALSRWYPPLLSSWEGRLLRIDAADADFRDPGYLRTLATAIAELP